MEPIQFRCGQVIPRTPSEICSAIANVARWDEFSGYGILPGIERAEYEIRTDGMVGSRIRVRNRDGSEHVEEITRWDPESGIAMEFRDFTPPLSRLATHFIEEWSFKDQDNATLVTRSFQMFASRSATRPIVWLISLFLRRAIARHLAEMVNLS
jgi:hypothetical protein